MDESLHTINSNITPGYSFSVIGAGNLGLHFSHALMEKNYRLASIYKKTRCDIERLSPFITEDMAFLVQHSDFIVISTQESRIREAVDLINAVPSHLTGKTIFHTSNSLTSDELLPLKEKGAYIASFSPLQTFTPYPGDSTPNIPYTSSQLFDRIYFQVEGDPEAMELAEKIASDIGAYILHVKKEEKIYIHIGAVCACNFLVSILKLSENQLKKAGASIDILLPLIMQTLKNIESKGVEASLTGPVKRKETGIVQKHLAHLEGKEKELYQALSEFLL